MAPSRSPCGRKIATASFDSTTCIWEYIEEEGWELAATLEGHENEVCTAYHVPRTLYREPRRYLLLKVVR